MSEPDHYRTLGVARFASERQVRNAYIVLMKRHHGTGGPSTLSEEAARRINRAYWELRHPERRASYDERLRRQIERHPAKPVFRWDGRSGRLAPPIPAHPYQRLVALLVLAMLIGIIGLTVSFQTQPLRSAQAGTPADDGAEALRERPKPDPAAD